VDEQQILTQISTLVDQEPQLRTRVQDGSLSSLEERDRLAQLEGALDQCWDLLRQRRANGEFGQNADESGRPQRGDRGEIPPVGERPRTPRRYSTPASAVWCGTGCVPTWWSGTGRDAAGSGVVSAIRSSPRPVGGRGTLRSRIGPRAGRTAVRRPIRPAPA
jgi:Protein of unknown function (DUF2630)